MSFLSPTLEEPKYRPRRASAPAAVGFLALCLALALAMVGAWAGAAADSAQAGHAGAGPVGDDVLHADEAWHMAEAGDLLLVDVRSPQEWRQTGVPAGARPVTIHTADGLVGFLDSIRKELNGDFDRPIAVICARGNRSSLAQSALNEAGYSQVLNIREGMLGSADGPGWLSRGLPIDDCGAC